MIGFYGSLTAILSPSPRAYAMPQHDDWNRTESAANANAEKKDPDKEQGRNAQEQEL
jgi:hypothetical protein